MKTNKYKGVSEESIDDIIDYCNDEDDAEEEESMNKDNMVVTIKQVIELLKEQSGDMAAPHHSKHPKKHVWVFEFVFFVFFYFYFVNQFFFHVVFVCVCR